MLSSQRDAIVLPIHEVSSTINLTKMSVRVRMLKLIPARIQADGNNEWLIKIVPVQYVAI